MTLFEKIRSDTQCREEWEGILGTDTLSALLKDQRIEEVLQQLTETTQRETKKYAEAQKTEAQEIKAQETEAQKTEAQETEAQETEAQETEAQETKAQNAEAQETEAQETEAQKIEAFMNSHRRITGTAVDRMIFAPVYQRLLSTMLQRLSEYPVAAEFFDEALLFQLLADVMRHIQWIGFRCFLQDMSDCLEQGRICGETPEAEYEDYIERFLGEDAWQNQIFDKYPVMTALILESAAAHVAGIDKIASALKQDRGEIVNVLCGGRTFDKVREMTMFLSDEHLPGQTTARLCLDNDIVIYYKPHHLDGQKKYQEWYADIEKSLGVSHFDYRLISKKQHGWELAVTQCDCKNSADFAVFYRRLGMQMCLAWIMQTSDLHCENVIAHGEFPVFVDMEMYPGRQKSRPTIQQDSVLYTGLLPVYGGDLGMNVAGIADGEKQKAPFKMPCVAEKRTSHMHIYYDHPVINTSDCVPECMGQKAEAWRYVKQIKQGFSEVYELIMNNKGTYRHKLSDIADVKSRYLFKNTQEYFMYQMTSNFPVLMQHQESRYMPLTGLSHGFEANFAVKTDEQFKVLLAYEIDTVARGLIPFYSMCGRNLYTGDGRCLEDFFQIEAAREIGINIIQMSKEGLQHQCQFIDFAFASHLPEIYPFPQKLSVAETAITVRKPVSVETAVEAAQYIADRILSGTIVKMRNNELMWMGIGYPGNGQTGVRVPVGTYLYDGLCGIALFMAAMGRKKYSEATEEEKYRERNGVKYKRENIYDSCSRDISSQLFAYTDGVCEKKIKVNTIDPGAFTGEGAVAYTYALLSMITEDTIYNRYADKHGYIVMKLLQSAETADLLSGMAGGIISLLQVYRVTGRKVFLKAAKDAGQRLWEQGKCMEQGKGWPVADIPVPLAGMAHGNSGIALAFAWLWSMTADRKYLSYISEALAYEDSLFREDLSNWPDMRVEEGRDMVAWCHGAAGILMARLKIKELTKGRIGRRSVRISDRQLAAAAGKIAAVSNREGCLCHGNAGLHSALRYYNKMTGKKIRDNWQPDQCSYRDIFQPGMMTGLSGLGYALLQEVTPELPEILVLDI